MKKNHIILTGAIVIILLTNFVIIPFLHRQEASNTVLKVLNYWKMGDSASGVHTWDDENKFPPIYGLASYTILTKKFSTHQGEPHARFEIKMDFTDGNLLPSGKIWICEAEHTKKGWKILEFYLPGITQ